MVLDPVPEVGWTPPRLNLLAVAAGGNPAARISTDWARYQTRNATAIQLLHAVQTPGLRHSLPQALLCNTTIPGRCMVQANGQLYYADDDHLSMLGARRVVDDMMLQASTQP